MGQTLRNMHGHSVIILILIILELSTKALFVLEKLWRLATPPLPSMLTIILSRFLISIAFFLNNSHLFSYFYFVLLIIFISPFLHIFH